MLAVPIDFVIALTLVSNGANASDFFQTKMVSTSLSDPGEVDKCPHCQNPKLSQ